MTHKRRRRAEIEISTALAKHAAELATWSTHHMPGAACRGSGWLFDLSRHKEREHKQTIRHRAAARICATCTAKQSCRKAIEQLPPGQRAGVWAGMVYDNGDKYAPGCKKEQDQ